MKAQTYRPRIQNGTVAKRRGRTLVQKVSDRSARARRPARGKSRREQERQPGSNVLWTLMCIGALVATGFVFALRSQMNAHQLGQAEAQLRAELEEIANRQRYEMLEQQRALSPREVIRAAKQAGLIQPKLNQPNLKIMQTGATRNQPEPPAKGKKEGNHQRQPERQPERQSGRIALRR
jgi:hypothetical protein